MQSRRGQLGLEPHDDVGAPGLRLLQVVHPQHGALHQDAHLVTELDPQDLVGPLARLHRRTDQLGLPHARLCLGHAAQSIGLNPHHLAQGLRPKPRTRRELDHLGVRQLLVADLIFGARRGGSRSLTDLHQQLDRHTAPLGELGEGDPAERREALERRRVEEGERDVAAPNGSAQAVHGDAGGDKAVHRADAAHVARREPIVRTGRQDSQLDHRADLIDADAASVGGLCTGVGDHGRTLPPRGRAAGDARAVSRCVGLPSCSRAARLHGDPSTAQPMPPARAEPIVC